jgi:hypothetical protein
MDRRSTSVTAGSRYQLEYGWRYSGYPVERRHERQVLLALPELGPQAPPQVVGLDVLDRHRQR